jgi:hypothetical protein
MFMCLVRRRLQRLMSWTNVTVLASEGEFHGSVYWGSLLPAPPAGARNDYSVVVGSSFGILDPGAVISHVTTSSVNYAMYTNPGVKAFNVTITSVFPQMAGGSTENISQLPASYCGSQPPKLVPLAALSPDRYSAPLCIVDSSQSLLGALLDVAEWSKPNPVSGSGEPGHSPPPLPTQHQLYIPPVLVLAANVSMPAVEALTISRDVYILGNKDVTSSGVVVYSTGLDMELQDDAIKLPPVSAGHLFLQHLVLTNLPSKPLPGNRTQLSNTGPAYVLPLWSFIMQNR